METNPATAIKTMGFDQDCSVLPMRSILIFFFSLSLMVGCAKNDLSRQQGKPWPTPGQIDSAIAVNERAIEADSLDRRALIRLGESYYWKIRDESCSYNYSACMKSEEHGKLTRRVEDLTQKARSVLDRAIKLDSSDVMPYYILMDVHLDNRFLKCYTFRRERMFDDVDAAKSYDYTRDVIDKISMKYRNTVDFLVREARFLQKYDDYDSAAVLLTRAEELEPNNPDIYFWQAQEAVWPQRSVGTPNLHLVNTHLMREALRYGLTHPNLSYPSLSKCLRDFGYYPKYAEIVRTYENRFQLVPLVSKIFYYGGFKLFAKTKEKVDEEDLVDLKLNTLLEAVRLYPRLKDYWGELKHIHILKKDYESAYKDFQKMLEIDRFSGARESPQNSRFTAILQQRMPNDPGFYVDSANNNRKDTTKCRQYLNRAITIDPSYLPAYDQLIFTYDCRKDEGLLKADSVLRKKIAVESAGLCLNSEDNASYLIQQWVAKGNVSKAIDLLERIEAAGGRRIYGILAAFMRGMPEKVKNKILDGIIRLGKNDALEASADLKVIGDNYPYRMEEQESISYYEQATRLCPSNLSAWCTLAERYQELKEYKKSLFAFEKATKLGSKYDPWGRANLAHVHAKIGNTRLADSLISDVLRKYVRNGYAYYMDGMIKMERGMVKEAVQAFRCAKELGSTFAERAFWRLEPFLEEVDIFASRSWWEGIDSPTLLSLYSVTGVNHHTAWAAGGNSQAPVVIRTVDGGFTWKDVTGNLTGALLYCVSAIDSMRAWVGTGNGQIFATTNGGTSWSAQGYPAPQSGFIDGIKVFQNLRGYALGDPASAGKFIVLNTTDGGVHWSHLANEPVGSATEAGWNNSFCWTDQLHGWFGTNNYRIWRTTDGGVSWSSGATPTMSSIAVSFGDNIHGIAGSGEGVISSSDGGATWSTIAGPTTRQGVTAVSYAPGTHSAWGTNGSFPYITRNDGGNWALQLAWPITGSINHIAMVDTTAGWMVSSYGEVLRYHLDYSLDQNNPNPFNLSITIRFNLPYRSNVRLTIYDLVGRKVDILVNKEFEAGSYEKIWSGGVASGIYFYRLEAVSLDYPSRPFVAVRKMLSLK
jgi:tetratricopeptide (TPR) repeat protein/photosystem II stability/assembly factor-like uncharacterized protein